MIKRKLIRNKELITWEVFTEEDTRSLANYYKKIGGSTLENFEQDLINGRPIYMSSNIEEMIKKCY